MNLKKMSPVIVGSEVGFGLSIQAEHDGEQSAEPGHGWK